jgi:hypothetical protein
VGYTAQSLLSASAHTQNAKKINIYNQMAQVLMGHDHTGSIIRFDADGSIHGNSSGDKHQECIFLNFSRLLVKDEIKKGSFALDLLITPRRTDTQTGNIMRVADTNAANDFRVNSPAGEYGILYASDLAGTATGKTLGDTTHKAGLIFYQAGIVVLTGSVFQTTGSSGFVANATIPPDAPNATNRGVEMYNTSLTRNVTFNGLLTGSAISASADAIRNRIYNVQFNNTTELNSTIYFCRVNHNDFNYSANPTYLNGSKIRVKNVSTDTPVSYITSVGLYSADNELLAVAKLSEPLKNDPTTELTLRVRLDY